MNGRSVVRVLTVVVLISFAFVVGTQIRYEFRSKKQVFRVISDAGVKDFTADRVEQRGSCSVFVTGGKEVAYFCFPHMIVPLGAEVAAPKSAPEAGAIP